MRDVKLLFAGSIATQSPWVITNGRHSYHELVAVMEGRMELSINGDILNASPGDVFFYRAGVKHDERSVPGSFLRTCFVGFNAAGLSGDLPVMIRDSSGRIRQLLRWIYDERSRNEENSTVSHPFLAALVAEYERLSLADEPPLVRDVRSYVLRHMAEQFSVDDLAAHAGMSKYHFIRSYKLAAGCTPMSDVRRMKIQSARNLLLTTGMPVKQIAENCGLGSPQHFSSLFKLAMGKTPGAMRRSESTSGRSA